MNNQHVKLKNVQQANVVLHSQEKGHHDNTRPKGGDVSVPSNAPGHKKANSLMNQKMMQLLMQNNNKESDQHTQVQQQQFAPRQEGGEKMKVRINSQSF